jgi:hypothetical protein
VFPLAFAPCGFMMKGGFDAAFYMRSFTQLRNILQFVLPPWPMADLLYLQQH